MANYLYNGVRLPALPEYDKTAYPYAIILTPSWSPDDYELLISKVAPYVTSDKYFRINGEVKGDVLRYEKGSTGWVHNSYTDALKGVIYATEPPSVYCTVCWSNHNVLNEDGSVYLSASDPIPVNPAPTLDPTALLMGWQVGNKIARQRGKA